MNHLLPDPCKLSKRHSFLFENSRRYLQLKEHHTTGAVDTDGKSTALIIVTSGKFSADVNDTDGLPELMYIFASLEKIEKVLPG